MTPTSSIGNWAVDARVAWRYRLDVPPVAMHAAPDDSYLLVADVFGTVRSLDPGSGEVQWEQTYGMQNVHDVRATLGGAAILLEEGRLLRLDAQGKTRWEAQVGALRSGFDATADGSLMALSAAVHEVVDDTVRIGSEVSLWSGDGRPVGTLRLSRATTRLRFTSTGGDLVCSSPEGHVTFLKGKAVAREADLGSAVDGLVSCLDGSLILMPAGTDGIHVLSAAMQSLGVLDVGGPVEDVDVSEDGSAILVKERDGLIYLLDGRFHLKWRGRMERPVLRVDLAGDGSFAYAAESSGEVIRFDFQPQDYEPPKVALPEDAATAEPAAQWELPGVSVRAGLGRLAFLGTAGDIAVMPRPSQLMICRPGQASPQVHKLSTSAAHATADPYRGRLALWSANRAVLLDVQGATREIDAVALTALVFCPSGDLALGTATGVLRRLSTDGEERFKVRVGAGVLAVAQSVDETLLVLCADGSLVKVDPLGEIVATHDFSRSVVASPDVEGSEEAEGLQGTAEPLADVDFWDKFARTFLLRSTPQGPVLAHGRGRILRLDGQLNVTAETHLEQELAGVEPLGDGLLAVEASGMATALDASLQQTARMPLGSRMVRVGTGAKGPVLFDADNERVWIRSPDGAVLTQASVYPEPRALAVRADGTQGAVLLDTRLLVFGLS